MATKTVLRLGDPVLRQVAKPVDVFNTPELRQLVSDMYDTMAAYDGAGLAAIQIGVPLRVLIFGFTDNPRYPDVGPVPDTVLINPEFEVLSDMNESGWEGCLSVPGLRGLVNRPAHIRYRGFDINGHLIEREATGFHARVFQHEYDHLNGVLYPDRITDHSSFGFIEELQASGVI